MPGDKTIVVEVKTGRTAVQGESCNSFKKENYPSPHYQTIHDRDSGGRLKRLQDIHHFIVAEREIREVKFDGAPASEAFLNCTLTTRLFNINP